MATVLEEIEVRELVRGDKKLVYVDIDASLDKALSLLESENILAVPVRSLETPKKNDDGTDAPPELKFSGLLSVLDVAAFVARDPDASGDSTSVTVSHVMRKTAESWHMLILDPHATVGRAMEYLGVRGFHRALIPNVCLSEHSATNVPLPSALVEEVTPTARGESFNVLSQLDIARFISSHEARFGLALAQSVESVGLEGGRVLATTKEEMLCDALDRMAGHAVSALAVVDKLEPGAPWAASNALLLDTLSASDLRGRTFQDLKQAKETSVGTFLTRKNGVSPKKLYTCRKGTDLRAVLKQMVEHSIHRLWVAPDPDQSKPEDPVQLLGVVSLSDIIRVMRILPFTNTPENVEDLAVIAFDSFMWMEWNI